MNTFGRLFKISIFGESHGESVGVLIGGCPAGLPVSDADFFGDLERRKSGTKGTTSRKESDRPLIKNGIFNGTTTGAPILILFENRDVDSSAYESMRYTRGRDMRTLWPFKNTAVSTTTEGEAIFQAG